MVKNVFVHHRPNRSAAARCRLAWLAALACAFAASAPPAWAGPTSAADILTDKQLAALQVICRKANEHVWTDPIIETFAKPPADGKGGWTAGPGATLDYKDGRVFLRGPKFRHIRRTLPAALNGCMGLRVDAWIQAAHNPNPAVGEFFQDQMVLGSRTELVYQFSIGADGLSQLLQTSGQHLGMCQSNPTKAGKLMHLTLVMAGDTLRTSYAGASMTAVLDNMPVLLPIKDLHLLITTSGQTFAIAQIAYRGLAPIKKPDVAAEWAAVPGGLNSQDALTRLLVDRTSGLLRSRRFRDRDYATDLLTAIRPLSDPALAALAQAATTEEVRLRIASVQAALPRVWVATSLPDDAIAAPHVADLPIPPPSPSPAANPGMGVKR